MLLRPVELGRLLTLSYGIISVITCSFLMVYLQTNLHTNCFEQNHHTKQECIHVGCVSPALHRKGGVSVRGGLCQGDPSPNCGQTDACEKITLFAGGKNN